MEHRHDRIDFTLIMAVAVYNLFLLMGATTWLFSNAFASFKKELTTLEFFQINENVTYSLFISGVLGGSFYCLRGLYQRLGEAYTPVGERAATPSKTFNIKVWFFWYLFRPIQGGVLALIILSLVNGNLMAAKQLDADKIKSFYSLVAIGFLCGFGSHEVIHKIQELLQVLFAKSKVVSSNSETKVKENNGKQ